jgi:putative oxidoreductase
MNLVQKIEVWGDNHHPKFIDFVRVALGIFLLLKGITFMQNSTSLENLIESQTLVHVSPGLLFAMVYYVTFVHMVGGILITLGIWTRFSCIMQMPIVLAAVFMTSLFQEPINTMAWPSITALMLLVLFAIIGSGPLSLDSYLTVNDEEAHW